MNTLNIRASKSTWLTTLAGLSLAFGAGTTVAEQGTTDTLPAITVEYVALDLATPAGAEALYKRIKAAAAKVCERYENRELAKRAVAQKCYSQSIANAVAAVHQPTLTALHESRSTTDPRG